MKVKGLIPIFLIFILSTVLIFTWFQEGYMYGGGDVGLPSYDPARTLEKSEHIWWEASAPGTTVPQGLTSVPFQVLQSFLHNIGLSPVMIQAFVFWSLLFLMGIGMYFLALGVFEENFLLATVAALFYMFNPYMMIQIWHRFIHNTIFLAAVLPFIYIFWKSWIKTGNYTKLFLYILTNLLGVYLFGTIAFIATIFILISFISLIEILFPWQGWKKFRMVSKRSILGIIFWSLANIWWLWPVLTIAPASLSLQHSIGESLGTLLAISRQAIIPYSLLGINSFYLYDKADWGDIYNNYFFRILPWLSLFFLIPGFIKGLTNRNWLSWSLLLILGLFLAKGAAAPFGYIYIWGFNHFFALGALRNPFEKLGILLPFSSAILITIGIDWYLAKFKSRLKIMIRTGICLIMVLLLIVNLWPMWLGKIFGTLEKPGFVEVPSVYKAADNFIKNQSKDGKILHLPLTSGESITYNWPHGYHGVEPSQLLFKSLPSVSHGFNINPVDDSLNALSYIFLLSDSEDKIISILQSFNIKFIVLHKDIEWHGGDLEDPQKLEKRLDEFDFLENKTQFGDLIVYRLKDMYFYSRLRLTNNISYFISSENNIYWPWLLSSNKSDLISSLQKKKDDLLIKLGTEMIIPPDHVYKYSPQKIVKENIIGEMPAAKVLPDSPLYLFIRIKEMVQYFSLPINDKFSFKLTLAGKRLVESYLIKEKKSSLLITPQLQEYQRILTEIRDGVYARSNGDEGSKELSINFILSHHLTTLELIKQKTVGKEMKIVESTITQLTNLMKEANITPYNQLIERENLPSVGRLISKFNLPISGKYELLQANEQSQGIYPNGLGTNDFQINNTVSNLNGKAAGNFISFGTVNLEEGLSEISFNSIPSIDLSTINRTSRKGDVKESGDGIEVTSSEHDSSYVDLNIDPIHGGNWYQLSFDAWFKLGDTFKIQIMQDTDPYDSEKPGEKIPSYDNDFHRDAYINDWNNNVFNFYVNPTTSKVVIRFLVIPWDGCKYFLISKTVCSNKLVKYIYEKSSKISFRNISVIRPLSNPIFLKSETAFAPQKNEGTVKYTQNSVTSYSGSISLSSPAFLIFSETYHPGWKLELFNPDKSTVLQRFVANNYSNAWYIDHPGNYTFKLEFTPERKVIVGLIISGLSILGLLIIVIKKIRP